MKYIVRLQSEILNEVRQAQSKEEKINILKHNMNHALDIIFTFVYGPRRSPYENGVPEYTPDDSPHGYSYSTLNKEADRLCYFFDTKYLIKNEKLRDTKIKNILEILHFSEASLLENVFKKTLEPYGITKEIIFEAFPQIALRIEAMNANG